MSLYSVTHKHAYELATGLILMEDEHKWQIGVRIGLQEILTLERFFIEENKPYNAYDLAEAYIEFRKETVALWRFEAEERERKKNKDKSDA